MNLDGARSISKTFTGSRSASCRASSSTTSRVAWRTNAASHATKPRSTSTGCCPAYLVDVSRRDQVRDGVQAAPFQDPFGISPTGGCRPLPARRRADAGRSRRGGEHPVHHVWRQQCLDGGSASVAPNNVSFQLYAAKDASITDALIGRARNSGAGALVLTVDVPVHPKRERNYRNGFSQIRGGGVLESLKLKPSILLEADDPSRMGHRICPARRGADTRNWAPHAPNGARAHRTSSLSAAVRPRPRRRPGSILSAIGASFRAPSSSRAS